MALSDRPVHWPPDPVPLGAVRIGSDGRYGLALLECAHCAAPLVGPRAPLLRSDAPALRVRLVLTADDYPLAVLEPPDALRAHVTASPRCRRACLAFRVAGVAQALRWERGVIAHVMEP